MTTRILTSAALVLVLFGAPAGAQSGPNAAATQAVSSGLAHVSRAEYQAALADFESALAMSPSVYGARSGMAEAYLGLNRLEDVRRVYMQLFVSDRVSANALMGTMKAWVSERHAEPAGVDAETLAEFAAWVHDRDALAAKVANLGHNMPDWK